MLAATRDPVQAAAMLIHMRQHRADVRKIVEADRDWFGRHAHRRYRCRDLRPFEFPPMGEGRRVIIVKRLPKHRPGIRQHLRFSVEVGSDFTTPTTDREIAKLIGEETIQ